MWPVHAAQGISEYWKMKREWYGSEWKTSTERAKCGEQLLWIDNIKGSLIFWCCVFVHKSNEFYFDALLVCRYSLSILSASRAHSLPSRWNSATLYDRTMYIGFVFIEIANARACCIVGSVRLHRHTLTFWLLEKLKKGSDDCVSKTNYKINWLLVNG